MYATLVGIYSVQYIIMWCLALMENQWRDKPATTETIQKQFLNWHMEGLCDWFWLLLDFNTVRCELIDSQTSSCGLSTNCQMSPCLLFLLSHLFPSRFFSPSLLHSSWQGEWMCCIRLDMLDKWADEVSTNTSSLWSITGDIIQFTHISPLQGNPCALAQILHVQSTQKPQY